MFGCKRIDVDLRELLRNIVQRASDVVRFQAGYQNVAGADLGLAEEQRRVVPAAIEHIDHGVGDARHVGLVLPKAVDDAGEIGHQAGTIDLVVVGGKAEVGTLLLKDVEQPVREFDIPVARALGVSQGLYERVIAGPVQFSGYGFKADIGHGSPPINVFK